MSVAFRLTGRLEALEPETDLLWQAGCTGIVQEGDEVVAYFERLVELPLPGYWQAVENKDWLAAYHASLKPSYFKRLVVAPSHCEVTPEPGRIIVCLDPGMAFGTGHHETTRLALRELESLELTGRRVLDVGAGSGILAIAADLLGAAVSLGIDLEPSTVPVASQNALLNASKATFRRGSLYQMTGDRSWDIVVANLYAELHVELAAEYARVLAQSGTLLATGILADRLPLVEEALEPYFEPMETAHEGEWSLVGARRR